MLPRNTQRYAERWYNGCQEVRSVSLIYKRPVQVAVARANIYIPLTS